MLTLKQITEQTEQVIAGLNKKHFKNAEEAIAQAIKLNDDRKKAQAQLDNNLAEGKVLAAKIGQAMKAGNKDEAEQAKAKVAELKKDLFFLRMQHATNQLDNPVKIAVVKKDIARIKTIIREKQTQI